MRHSGLFSRLFAVVALAIDDVVPKGKFPKLVRSEGDSPLQYPEDDEDDEAQDDDDDE